MIELMYEDGYSYREIAELVGYAENSVANTIYVMRKAGWELPYRYKRTETLANELLKEAP